jgi:hypothetical protein
MKKGVRVGQRQKVRVRTHTKEIKGLNQSKLVFVVSSIYKSIN